MLHCIKPVNVELNPICHLLALLGAHHILHFSRIRDKGHFNPLNAELNTIFHLLALLRAHHILHVSRVRVKGHFNSLNAELNPICHLLALLEAHHILLIGRVTVKEVTAVHIPVAARSQAWVCGRSLVGIAGSNPAGGMDFCRF